LGFNNGLRLAPHLFKQTGTKCGKWEKAEATKLSLIKRTKHSAAASYLSLSLEAGCVGRKGKLRGGTVREEVFLKP